MARRGPVRLHRRGGGGDDVREVGQRHMGDDVDERWQDLGNGADCGRLDVGQALGVGHDLG